MGDPDISPGDPREAHPRVLSTQVAIAVTLGVSAFISFSVLRYKWPKLYASRSTRKKGLPVLPKNLLGWVVTLYNISEEEILEYAGLDAYVYLGFFKMAIKLLSVCTLCGVVIISPIRLYFTGRYDQDDDYGNTSDFLTDTGVLVGRALVELYSSSSKEKHGKGGKGGDDHDDDDYNRFFWLYVVFTYVFTLLTISFLMHQTMKVIKVRQYYLGSQNSITDRTIRVSGISPSLRSEQALKEHIEALGIGHVQSVSLCFNWHVLDQLFDKRNEILTKLERAWCEYLGPTWTEEIADTNLLSPSSYVDDGNGVDVDLLVETDRDSGRANISVSTSRRPSSEQFDFTSLREPHSAALQLGSKNRDFKRPTERVGLFGWFGPKIDIIDKYTYKLEALDERITKVREENKFEVLDTAFVTMDSVASAQMTAQAVLDPKPYTLIAETAPAPHDVIWKHVYMSRRESMLRTYLITLIVAVLTSAMVFSVSYYLARFLTVETIKKFWPSLAEKIAESEWAVTFVTGILPPLLYTVFNAILPFLYIYLSGLQGYVSSNEVELSAISKNFFYVFFYMFLFTVAGTASNYWSYLKDTTKFALTLAKSLQDFSSFYIDLIILQGIGMFPFRLLQIGSVLKFPWTAVKAKSPRDFRDIYKPVVINYGIHLPQPVLILMVVLLYSVISTKILVFGTSYFLCGYFVYKYQLMYCLVHPQHSTGRAWPLIFRRVCLGLIIFHLTMVGILALQYAYFLAAMLTPLPVATMLIVYNFEKTIVPLLRFIALRAIRTTGSETSPFIDFSLINDEEAEVGGASNTSAIDQPQDHMESGDDDDDDDGQGSETRLLRDRSHSRTLDEQREKHQKYINPNLVKPLDGPWIGIDGDFAILANPEGTVKKRMHLEEWE